MIPSAEGSGGDGKPRNRLADASSPYLLQHADNPVAWQPWGDGAFEEARRRDVPVFLSVGYSTCHWCHVMAHESFEDEEVAERLNRDFVPVKVDREERPDVDGVYMTACQLLTGSGGWPLTVVTTPDRRPFFAGTYFPKERRGGRPGLLELLEGLARAWRERREEVLETARRITAALETASRPPEDDGAAGRDVRPERRGGSEHDGGPEQGDGFVRAEDRDVATLAAGAADAAFRRLAGAFDSVHGGFGGAPKFPSPHRLLFLMRYGARTGRREAAEMVAATLEGMRCGGVYDHLGGGFHRYATDARWHLPHFEKMLYDQALLAFACAEARCWLEEPGPEHTARETLDYLLRDLRDPGGGFHAAEDADSDGEEGLYYLWTPEELEEVLGRETAELAARAWGVREGGNFVEESTGRPTGRSLLHTAMTGEELAERKDLEPAEVAARLEEARRRLLAAREARPRPGRDDKVLTDWNGLAVAALARAGGAFGVARYREAAGETADFLLEELRDAEGLLLHRWRKGRAAVAAQVDDYAFLIWGLLELHAATFEPRWLREALRLQEAMDRRLWDGVRGAYWSSAGPEGELPVRRKSVHDGAIPSGNSVAAWNLLRLSRLTGKPALEERAWRIAEVFSRELHERSDGCTGLLVGLEMALGEGHEVVLAGPLEEGTGREMVRLLRRRFLPRTVSLAVPEGEARAEALAELAPYVRGCGPVEGRAAAYVCTGFACREPVTEPAALARELGVEPPRRGDGSGPLGPAGA